MTTIEVLKKARELVARPGGWCQHDYAEGDACCAIGAINLAAGRSVDDDDPHWGSADALALHALDVAIGNHHVPFWNDAPGRTQAEVVAAFDRAIALAEAANG